MLRYMYSCGCPDFAVERAACIGSQTTYHSVYIYISFRTFDNRSFCLWCVVWPTHTGHRSCVSGRIVTIGPFVFLGVLGVTYRVGSRPAKPRMVEEPVAKRGSCPSRATGGTGLEYQNSGSVSENNPISRYDSSRSTASPKPAQCIAPNVTFASAVGCGAPTMGKNRQTSLVVPVGDEGVAKTGQTSPAAANDTRGPKTACSMWQAESESEPMQVR